MRPVCIPITLACCTAVAGVSPASESPKGRFVEFHMGGSTVLYDLTTVDTIVPGRFTIMATTIDDPNVMKFELTVLGVLSTFCGRSDGKYEAPMSLLTLGKPNRPIEKIDVRNLTGSVPARKFVWWPVPYEHVVINSSFTCRSPFNKTQDTSKESEVIMNGVRTKELFDCKRAVRGQFFDMDDPSPVETHVVQKDTVGEDEYIDVCLAVMKNKPYLPP